MNLKGELQTMSITDLRSICRDLGVSCPKTKSGIIKRLLFPLKKEYKLSKRLFDKWRKKREEEKKKAKILKFRRPKYEDRKYYRKIKIKDKIMEKLRNPLYTNDSRILEELLNYLRKLGFKIYQDEYDSKFSKSDEILIGQIMKKIQKKKIEEIREENEQKRAENMIKRIELMLDMSRQLKYIKQQVVASGTLREFPRCEVYENSIKLLEDLKKKCKVLNVNLKKKYINEINYLIDTYKTNIENENCSY